MLTELRIAGLGVIDDAVLPLGPGLTVVTGETGAGKTMVVTGLQLLFGARGDSERVRTGSAQTTIDGRLLVGPDSRVARRVRDAGGELDGEPGGAPGDEGSGESGGGRGGVTARHELVLRRTVGRGGRSRAYVGGAPAPVAVLAELAADLVAVHGQADQIRLVRPAAQRAALDRYAAIDLTSLRAAFDRWRAALTELTDRSTRAGQLRRESDVLAHGIAEISAAAPRPEEPGELAALAARLGQANALTLAARTAHDTLIGGAEDVVADASDVNHLLAVAVRAVSQQDGTDAELDALGARLAELSALAADLGADFGSYADAIDADPARLAQIEQRRAELAALVRKYCDEPEPTIAGVMRWAEAAQRRLEQIDVSDEAIALLRARCADAEKAVVELAERVSAQRHEAAEHLTAAVTAELAGLAMAEARLTIAVTDREPVAGIATVHGKNGETGIGPDGFDDVAFLLTAHDGAPALPIGRGASGGELSRIMLALEVCLLDGRGNSDSAPLLVFDEVDAGVGGRAATEVGRRLARLGAGRQVLAVTHLAQVAAYADRHLVVDKPPAARSAGGVSASDIRVVGGEERTAELARMLGGADTAAAREHATELLAEAVAARTKPDRRASRDAARGRTPRRAGRTAGRGSGRQKKDLAS